MRLTSKTNVFCNIGFMHFNEAITSTESDGKNKKKYSTYSRYRKILFRRSHFNVDTIPIIIFPCYYFYYYFFFLYKYIHIHTHNIHIHIYFFFFFHGKHDSHRSSKRKQTVLKFVTIDRTTNGFLEKSLPELRRKKDR